MDILEPKVQSIQLMADQVVDIKFALEQNNGDKSRLMQKLEEFEVQSLSESLLKVADCIEK